MRTEILAAIALLAGLAQPSEKAMRVGSDLLDSELIVRGRITSVQREFFPVAEISRDPKDQDCELEAQVHVIAMSVDEVMRGHFNQREIRFLAETGWSDLSGTYAVGDETIVGLAWRSFVRNGEYVVLSDYGRFIKEGSSWVQQGPSKPRIEKKSLDRLIEDTRIPRLVVSSSLVVIGEVTSSRPATIEGPAGEKARARKVGLAVIETLKGLPAPDCEFSYIVAGDYWPDWRGPRPRFLRLGEQVLVFLTQFESGYVLNHGVGGVFSVRGDELYFRGEARMRETVEKIRIQIGADHAE